jgi:hypothetical protein
MSSIAEKYMNQLNYCLIIKQVEVLNFVDALKNKHVQKQQSRKGMLWLH